MADFNSILNCDIDTIEAPKQLPDGSYDMVIVAINQVTSKQKQIPMLEVEAKIQAPREDVDMEAYGEVKNPCDKSYKRNFVLTPEAMNFLKEFILICLGDDKKGTLNELLPQCVGQNVVGVFVKKLSDKGNEYTTLDKFIAA